MSDWEARLIPGIRPRRVELIEHPDGKKTEVMYWPWHLPPKKTGHRIHRHIELWRPP